MINQLTTFTLNLLKTNLSLVLIFYASGFLSFIAYYRVLGLPYIAGDLQTYAEMAGKNLLFILQTFLYLVTQPNYFVENSNALNWVGNAVYIWLAAVLLLLIIYAVVKWLPPKPIIIRIRQHPYTAYVRVGLIVIAVLASFDIEIQSFYIKNVLQPTNVFEFQQQKQNLLSFEKQSKEINSEKRVKIASQLNSDTNKVATHFFFAIPKNIDPSGNYIKRTNALILMILMVSITAIILVLHRKKLIIKWLIFFFSFAQAILIPFNCGILSSNYQYPVVSLAYTEKEGKDTETVVHKEGVFLLAKSLDSLIIYDRLNLFQISYIPQNSVVHLEQIFTSSPFSNCSNGEFTPCEISAINQSSD